MTALVGAGVAAGGAKQLMGRTDAVVTVGRSTSSRAGRGPLPALHEHSPRRGVVYVAPGCFAHPESRAFWLGGGSEGRRAQGQ